MCQGIIKIAGQRSSRCNKWFKALFNIRQVITYLLTYLLTPWSRVLLEKLASLQLVKNFPAFYGTRRFLTALTSARHLSLSWASPIQSSYPNPTSWRSILILFSHLRLGLPSGLFPSGFPTSNLYTPLPSSIRATCPAHLILLDFITRAILGDEYRPFSSSLCNFLRQVILKENAGGYVLRNESAVPRYNENGKVSPAPLPINSVYLHLSFLSSNFNFPHVRAQT